MPTPSRRFDGYLASINSDRLKPMMRLWSASTQLRKDECIAVIRQGLADPAKVKAALATLTPFETNTLALLKAAGGAMDVQGLTIALRTTGVVPRDKRPSQIVTSPRLRRYLRGEVAPDLVIVDQAKLAAFEEQLRWAGLQVTGELSVKVRKH